MSLSPEELKIHIDEKNLTPADIAKIDQRQKALDDNRDTATWWAALMTLSRSRDNIVAYAMALHNLRMFLNSRQDDGLVELAIFFVNDMVMRVAKYEYGGDIDATLKAMIIEGQMPFMEKFIDTDGASCPSCGADNGWNNHCCEDVEE